MSRSIGTYVALGDSFTCGTDPEREGRWPDEVARALGPGVHYENLAEVGATSAVVERAQLTAGIALRPDLLSLVCGANDVLESVRPDAGELAERLDRMLGRIRRALPDAAVFTATYPDLSRFMELRPRSRERVRQGMRELNAALRRAASENDALLLEWAEHPGTGERGNFASDGFHPSPDGHRRAGREVVAALEARLGIDTRAKEAA